MNYDEDETDSPAIADLLIQRHSSEVISRAFSGAKRVLGRSDAGWEVRVRPAADLGHRLQGSWSSLNIWYHSDSAL